MLDWLLQAAAVSAALACIAWVASRRLPARPAVCHALWLLVVLRLLVPPGVVGSWTLPILAPDPPAAIAAAPPSTLPRTVVRGDMPAATESQSALAMPAASLPWGALLGWAWLVGAFAMACAILRRIVIARRVIRRGRVAERRVRRIVHRVATRMRVAPPRVVAVEDTCAPFVWALGRPRLVVPSALAASLDGAALEAVIVHELAHVKRRDHWVGRALLVASVLHWWNPVFWWARRRIQETAEQSCDAWVVDTLPDARHRYANTLIEVSRIVTAGPPALAIGMGSVTYHELKRRLHMILDTTPRRGVPTVGAVAIALLALVASPDVTLAQSATETPAEPRAAGKPPVGMNYVRYSSAVDPRAEPAKPRVNRDLAFRFEKGQWIVRAGGSIYTLNRDGTMMSQPARRPTSRRVGASRYVPDVPATGTASGGSRSTSATPFATTTREAVAEYVTGTRRTPTADAGVRAARKRVVELEREVARLEKMIRELSRDADTPPRR